MTTIELLESILLGVTGVDKVKSVYMYDISEIIEKTSLSDRNIIVSYQMADVTSHYGNGYIGGIKENLKIFVQAPMYTDLLTKTLEVIGIIEENNEYQDANTVKNIIVTGWMPVINENFDVMEINIYVVS